MKVSFKWLKEFVQINCSIEEMSHKFTMSGSKVEKIHYLGRNITNTVVGQIDSIIQHPNADKLVITKINIGQDAHKQIVTGATNIKEGDIVPVALHGASLANGLEIKKGKIRGEVSEGMLCSIEELGFSVQEFPEASDDGIYIFPDKNQVQIGQNAMEALGLVDELIEFEITPNRVDCYSIMGIAKEAAAVLGEDSPALEHLFGLGFKADEPNSVPVEIKSNNCHRYIAKKIKNVKIEPSPEWLRLRLINSGIKPINNIVDITNYILLETGQPMHAFDARQVDSGILVRTAFDGEKITTLDGIERQLPSDCLLIADNSKALGIAGIMGGDGSKILDDTTEIILESAIFDGNNIRKTSKQLGLRTESSSKFEKGLDPNLAIISINRAVELIKSLEAGEVCEGLTDVQTLTRDAFKIPFEPSKINALLGLELAEGDMLDILQRLGIKVKNGSAIIPTNRYDIEGTADLAEEIARLYGYDKIMPQIAKVSHENITGGKNAQQKQIDTITDFMLSFGYNEAQTFAFESKKALNQLLLKEGSQLRNYVEIQNPLGEDTSIMRTQMANAMLGSLATNFARRNDYVSLFEIANIYCLDNSKIHEAKVIAAAHYGYKDFFAIKGEIELIFEAFGIKADYERMDLEFLHPGKSAKITVDDEVLGFFGEVHPKVLLNYDIGKAVVFATLDLEKIFRNSQFEKQYTELPKYPSISRDIAIIANPSETNKNITEKIRENGGKNLKEIRLFDVYQGGNLGEKKSMAYNLNFQSNNKTLTDVEINKAMEKIIKALKESGLELRT